MYVMQLPVKSDYAVMLTTVEPLYSGHHWGILKGGLISGVDLYYKSIY